MLSAQSKIDLRGRTLDWNSNDPVTVLVQLANDTVGISGVEGVDEVSRIGNVAIVHCVPEVLPRLAAHPQVVQIELDAEARPLVAASVALSDAPVRPSVAAPTPPADTRTTTPGDTVAASKHQCRPCSCCGCNDDTKTPRKRKYHHVKRTARHR